jgi:hypothetical protein
MLSLHAPWLLRNILVMVMVILSLFLVAIQGHPLVSACSSWWECSRCWWRDTLPLIEPQVTFEGLDHFCTFSCLQSYSNRTVVGGLKP